MRYLYDLYATSVSCCLSNTICFALQGQTPFDVADEDMLEYLSELKLEQKNVSSPSTLVCDLLQLFLP